ncbi:beta family protein [Allokutzneria albata]|uniref:beta family protein n=1 Tax=Allokutzneria albata TaxID=211114 RepID=UPI0038990AE2
MNHPDFAGSDYSWGDRELVRCRRGGKGRAGAPRRWIAMATSHHLGHLSRRTSAEF